MDSSKTDLHKTDIPDRVLRYPSCASGLVCTPEWCLSSFQFTPSSSSTGVWGNVSRRGTGCREDSCRSEYPATRSARLVSVPSELVLEAPVPRLVSVPTGVERGWVCWHVS